MTTKGTDVLARALDAVEAMRARGSAVLSGAAAMDARRLDNLGDDNRTADSRLEVNAILQGDIADALRVATHDLPLLADAAAALVGLVAARTVDQPPQPSPWWAMKERGDGWCLFCQADVDLWRDGWGAISHAPDCPAMAADAALAALAGDA